MPYQVARYAFQGKPLWSTLPQPPPIQPPCEECGASRCFELQLLPTLLESLDADATAEDGHGMEWNTVVAYTCSQCCTGASQGSYHREWAYVQEDDIKAAFSRY